MECLVCLATLDLASSTNEHRYEPAHEHDGRWQVIALRSYSWVGDPGELRLNARLEKCGESKASSCIAKRAAIATRLL